MIGNRTRKGVFKCNISWSWLGMYLRFSIPMDLIYLDYTVHWILGHILLLRVIGEMFASPGVLGLLIIYPMFSGIRSAT